MIKSFKHIFIIIFTLYKCFLLCVSDNSHFYFFFTIFERSNYILTSHIEIDFKAVFSQFQKTFCVLCVMYQKSKKSSLNRFKSCLFIKEK